jgi:Putative peptidoglycan binding domain
VIRLQRLAGNRAVSRMLVQRACMLELPPPNVASAGGPSPAEVAAPPAEAGGGSATAQAPPPTTAEAPVDTGPAGADVPDMEPALEQTPALDNGKAPAGEAGGAAATGGTHRTLRFGSRGDDVKEAQGKLNDQGATPPLNVDGIYGPKTTKAAQAFQSSHKLVADGITGPKTWSALDGGVKPPEPNEGRKKLLAGVTITVIGHDSSAAAITAAQQIQDEEWKNMSDDALKTVQGMTVELHVIPADKKMTELDEFKSLKGKTTFDGRIWDDVRGINIGKTGTKIQSAVGEETLVKVDGKPAGYALGFVASHESGHSLRSGFTPEMDAQLVLLYGQRIKDKGQPPQPKTGDPPEDNTLDDWLAPRWYTASNADEYLAQSVAAYFTHPYNDEDKDIAGKYTPDWLKTNDSGMYDFLTNQVFQQGTLKKP